MTSIFNEVHTALEDAMHELSWNEIVADNHDYFDPPYDSTNSADSAVYDDETDYETCPDDDEPPPEDVYESLDFLSDTRYAYT